MNCPQCNENMNEKKGSPVSPWINTYACPKCNQAKLRCGNSSCDGFMEASEMGYPNTIRYTCTKCGWSGTGARL